MSVFPPEKTYPRESDQAHVNRLDDAQSSPEKERSHEGHSRWMMIACCIPMLAIAVAVVAAGGGAGFLVIAVMCTVMMALMMGGMSSRDKGEGGGSDANE
jgi:hypothetical protein